MEASLPIPYIKRDVTGEDKYDYEYSTNTSQVIVSRSGHTLMDENYYEQESMDYLYPDPGQNDYSWWTRRRTVILPNGTELVHQEHQSNPPPITETTGTFYWIQGITRSGHPLLSDAPNYYLSTELVAEGAPHCALTETPDGDPIVTWSLYGAQGYQSKIRVQGQWLATKNALPDTLDLRGVGFWRGTNQIWRNGFWRPIYNLVPSSYGYSINPLLDVNDHGIICAIASRSTDDQGLPLPQPEEKAALLIPIDMAVDANRDGVVKFAGNFSDPNAAGKPQDRTEESKPFRFWCNDDHDISDTDESGEGLTGAADSADNEIKSERDLEDFTRLHLYFGGLQEAIANGTIKVGLEWRDTSGGSPSIKVYQAAEPDGGTQYLRNDNGSGGLGNEYAAILQTATPFKTALGTIDSNGGFKFPASFWESTGSGIPPFDADHPNRYIIFEGVTAGKGQLVMTFWKGTTKIGEGGGCWLDIKQIKKMYQRWDSASGTGSHPWAADEFEAPPNEPKDDAIIFVHGWRMNPEGAGNFAETMFKRLWQRGFKGRFVAFHWDTWWYDAWQWLPQHDTIGAALAHYNDSELTAWQTGNTLKSKVDSLPFKNKNLIAHSMGNIVVSEALRQGMSIKNYAMLNAAVPASCYDEDETRIRQAPKAGPAGITLAASTF
jgi:hypothetical protein